MCAVTRTCCPDVVVSARWARMHVRAWPHAGWLPNVSRRAPPLLCAWLPTVLRRCCRHPVTALHACSLCHASLPLHCYVLLHIVPLLPRYHAHMGAFPIATVGPQLMVLWRVGWGQPWPLALIACAWHQSLSCDARVPPRSASRITAHCHFPAAPLPLLPTVVTS